MSGMPRPHSEPVADRVKFQDERDERAWVSIFSSLLASTRSQRISQERHAKLIAEEADALLQHVRARRPESFFGPYRK